MSGAGAPSALRSTEDVFRSPVAVFTGPYAASRARLDYSWHAHYTPARQATQDAIIRELLAGGGARAAARPWLVHTAGAMGAGKSHVLRALARAGAFPLAAFVLLDPDRAKDALPEARALVAADAARAGSLLHKESVFICEVAEREALAARRSVLVDGSLRDAPWFAQKFAALRAEAPEYRIGVIHVTASRAVVHARSARRARATGRTVPPDVIDRALDEVPAAVRALAPLVDFSARIANEADDERALVFEDPPGATLESFARVWDELRAEEAAAGGERKGAAERA